MKGERFSSENKHKILKILKDEAVGFENFGKSVLADYILKSTFLEIDRKIFLLDELKRAQLGIKH